jgi:hypothetical protein
MSHRVKTVGFLAVACGTPAVAQSKENDEAVSLDADVATEQAPEELRAFAGEYTFAGGETERQALRDAVDGVVAEMNPLVRGIARDRLLESNAIAGKVAIAADGREVTVSFDDRAYTAVLGASAVEVTGLTGDALQLTHRLSGKRLVQMFAGKRGSRRNVITARGKQLRIAVTVTSESLPGDLVYQLTFARK